jgi:hypothetical protein
MDFLHVIWGLKTQALFDVWSIEHILSGVSIGSAVQHKNLKEIKKFLSNIGAVIRRGEYQKLKKFFKSGKLHSLHFDIMGVLFLAYAWETLEHYLETGLAGGVVEYWFQGVEMWGNRLITDPLLMILGYYIAKKHPNWVNKARVLSLIWLFVHVFIFPHSMYLHEIL